MDEELLFATLSFTIKAFAKAIPLAAQTTHIIEPKQI